VKDVYLFEAIRSPRTKAKATGGLHSLAPPELLSQLYRALETRTGVDPHLIDEIVLGCVTQHGEQAANLAKTSALFAGWPASIAGLTVNRFCSSSIDAMAIAAMKIAAGYQTAAVAGGIEMMSRVPLLADGARVFSDSDYGIAHQVLLMGSGADLIATRVGASRSDCDAVAVLSHQRAALAQDEGRFQSIVPIHTESGVSDRDECIRRNMTAERFAALPPAFVELGDAGADAVQLKAFGELSAIEHVHTAGNSPAMCDAAAVVLMGDESLGDALGIPPKAKLVMSKTACGEPLEVVSGCVAATETIMRDAGMSISDIDVFEIHEAFAATIVKAKQELHLDDERLNVNGGCIALGHPMGATGAIMMSTVLDELIRSDQSLGLVAASGAAGSGSSILVERC
jgi:acetyl-CoA C-acetyltransferase